VPFDLIQQRRQRPTGTSLSDQGMMDRIDRTAMLERQRGDDRGVLCIGFRCAAGLGTVYEDLGDAAVVKSADATGVHSASRSRMSA
jgi:hypothetical protein